MLEIHAEPMWLGIRVWVIGDSILRGVANVMQDNFNLEADCYSVEVECHPGGTLRQQLEELGDKIDATPQEQQPEFVIFHMGSNDICCGSIQSVILQWREAALRVQDRFPALKLVFCSILRRHGTHRRMQVSLSEFEIRRMGANHFMQNIMVDNVKFWEHSHRRFTYISSYRDDGIHLSESGKRALARSIRGAVIRFCK